MTTMIDEKLKAGNVINLDLDTPIYKYIPFKYLKLMIQNSNLYFGKVSSWEDVYENWFLKEQMVLPTGEKGDAMDLIPGVFGQSWTLQEESDAMWRIYSKLDRTQHDYLDDTAVRIKTTARKLYNVIYANDEDFYTSYIGAVKYLSQDDFLKMQDSLSPLNPLDLSEVFVKSYFFKRASCFPRYNPTSISEIVAFFSFNTRSRATSKYTFHIFSWKSLMVKLVSLNKSGDL